MSRALLTNWKAMTTCCKPTEMQRRLSISKHIRTEIINATCAAELFTPGYKRLVKDIMREILQDMTEPRIKQLMFELLQCNDITEAQRREALYILSASETALSKQQKKQLNKLLY